MSPSAAGIHLFTTLTPEIVMRFGILGGNYSSQQRFFLLSFVLLPDRNDDMIQLPFHQQAIANFDVDQSVLDADDAVLLPLLASIFRMCGCHID